MDLPPVPAPAPTQQPQQPGVQPPPPPPPAHGNPVGRPSSDPDRQQERAETNANVARMLRALPKQATDPKVAVYRLRGRSGRHTEPQAVMKILVSDIEEAIEAGQDSEGYLQQVIADEVGPGRYLCVPQDAHGNRVKKAAQWEVTVDGDGWEDEEEEEPRGRAHHVPGIGRVYDYDEEKPEPHNPYGSPYPPHNPYGSANSYAAPPPPGGHETPAGVLSEVRSILDSQKSNSGSDTQMFAMMFQMSAQQREEQRRYDEQMRREREERERERREEERKWREEERLREERREQREKEARNERLQLLATIVPVLVPLLQKMMDKPKDEITPILMTKLLDGDKSRDHLHEIMAVMGESTRQQLLSSSELSRQQMQQMGEMNKMSMQHVLQLAQDTMAAGRDLQSSEDDDPVGKFTRVLKTIAPMLSGYAQQRGQPGGYPPAPASPRVTHAPPAPASPAPQPQPQPQPLPAADRRAPSSKQPPPPLPTRDTQPEVPDEEWIRGALDTIRRLETGELAAEERPKALAWCASNLPQEMQAAIASGNEEAILEHAAPIVMADQTLREWLSVERHQAFLRGAVNDMRRLLTTQPTEHMMAQMVAEQQQYNAYRTHQEGAEEAERLESSDDGLPVVPEEDELLDTGDHYNQTLPEDFYRQPKEEDKAEELAEQGREDASIAGEKRSPPPASAEE